MATLTTLTASLRNDLQDTASSTWTDALLERAITKAVGDFGLAWPVVASVDEAGVTDQRRYDLSATTGLLWVEAVEHEKDQDPPEFHPFREESRGVIYLLGDIIPATGDTFAVWYARTYTVDASGSTIPAEYEEFVLTGAFGHAFLMRASDTVGRINPSTWAPRQARDLAAHRLDEFSSRLKELRNRRAAPWWRPTWGTRPRDWGTV